LLVRARDLVAEHDAIWADLQAPPAKPAIVNLMSEGRLTALRILGLARTKAPATPQHRRNLPMTAGDPRWLAEAMVQVFVIVAEADGRTDPKEIAAAGNVIRQIAFSPELPLIRAAAILAASDESVLQALTSKSARTVFDTARSNLEALSPADRRQVYVALLTIGFTVADAHGGGLFSKTRVSDTEAMTVRLCLEAMGATSLDIRQAMLERGA
jgi:hypothetical protein